VGKEHPIMRKDAKQLVKKLRKQLGKEKVEFDYLKNENHATILHMAVYRAFEYQNRNNNIK
jgi:predicted alpha/beta superfamily hydrolase